MKAIRITIATLLVGILFLTGLVGVLSEPVTFVLWQFLIVKALSFAALVFSYQMMKGIVEITR